MPKPRSRCSSLLLRSMASARPIIRYYPAGASAGAAGPEDQDLRRKPRILVAGGGVGPLVLALAAKRRGFEVRVFEKDLSAVRGEGRHRGPIQLGSNALAVLQAIDGDVTGEVMAAGCVTGDRINGIADGLSGEWFTKFDLLTPAVNKGLPVTQVICRMQLQDILLKAVGFDIVSNRSNVVDFKEHSNKVTVILDDGREYEGDVLVGADGIWSKVRGKLFGCQDAQYSNYTCYSGLVDYVAPYISSIRYRVFLDFNQYFVASDVGCGRCSGKRESLLELFGSWCDEVVTLISKTPEPMIVRRDIYDRDMIYTWARGHVALLGDAAHAMQPNLGQSGCMAIEDSYQLILELEKAVASGRGSYGAASDEIALALKRYERKRVPRVSAVHAVARMASKMVSTYHPYLDFGSGYLSFLTKLRIPHPAIYGARFFAELSMPILMSWMLMGNGCDEGGTLGL